MQFDRTNSARLIGRVRRLSSTVPCGRTLLEFISSTEARNLLAEAAERSEPSIGAISKKLLALVGRDILKQTLVKQFCGLATRAVLAEEGFVPMQLGVRLRADPVFTAGTVYGRTSDSE